MKVWVLFITDGESIEFPPEIYQDRAQGIDEAEHWAAILAEKGTFEVRRPFDGRWEIGFRDVRLVAATHEDFDPSLEWWMGVHWTGDGFPDPECVLLGGNASALEWVLAATVDGATASSVYRDAWQLAARFEGRGAGSESVAVRAKVISTTETPTATVGYQVELVGTFVQSINGLLHGPPGLDWEGIQEIVEREWGDLSAETGVLLESSWELEGFRQMPS